MGNLDFNSRLRFKYTSSPGQSKKEYRQKSFDQLSLAALSQHYEDYFNEGPVESVCLLFIDICNFSTRYEHLDGSSIGSFFDLYYSRVMPLIFKYEGVIERVIGDGIVALFGNPFTDIHPSKCFILADKCAREILVATNGTRFSSKIAFHAGKIRYFKNNSGYEDYTIIGKPVTELFRLEGVSMEESINYFDRSIVKIYYDRHGLNDLFFENMGSAKWIENHIPIEQPKGTTYKGLYYLQYNQ